MKKLLCITLCVLLLTLPCLATPEPAAAPALQIAAPSGILMHPSGMVLYEKDADTPRPPASVTKVMTLLLIMEALDGGSITLQDPVTASAHACSMGGSQIWLKEGEVLTVEEMLKCITIASANDCAVAMAEHLAGSEEAFVQQMNQRAQELGMTNTHFVNCCGLDAEGHVTTARDIALMSAELMRHERIKNYTLVWQDTIRDGAFTLTNTNKLIKSYQGITGLKTGSTSTAGFCLSATAERDGLQLIAVVMHGETSATRNADITAMLNYGFATYAAVNLTPDQPLMPVPVTLGQQEQVTCRLADSQPLVLEKAKLQTLTKEIVMEERLEAPVEAGAQVGTMTVCADGAQIASIPIVTEAAVERMTFFQIFRQLLRVALMRQ